MSPIATRTAGSNVRAARATAMTERIMPSAMVWNTMTGTKKTAASESTTVRAERKTALPDVDIAFSIALMASLPGKRLLVPLVANLSEAEVGAHGHLVEKSAELAIVAVATPDGATAIPAFTDVDSMRAWRAEARPVPVSVEKLALAAACYANHSAGRLHGVRPATWPWDWKWWKPTNPRRDLVKAAALILAEIDRIDRAALKGE